MPGCDIHDFMKHGSGEVPSLDSGVSVICFWVDLAIQWLGGNSKLEEMLTVHQTYQTYQTSSIYQYDSVYMVYGYARHHTKCPVRVYAKVLVVHPSSSAS